MDLSAGLKFSSYCRSLRDLPSPRQSSDPEMLLMGNTYVHSKMSRKAQVSISFSRCLLSPLHGLDLCSLLRYRHVCWSAAQLLGTSLVVRGSTSLFCSESVTAASGCGCGIAWALYSLVICRIFDLAIGLEIDAVEESER